MKITEIRLDMLRVPLKTPFKTALRTIETVEDIVVSMHTDTGHVGYGAAAATAVITGDTHGSIVDAIRSYLVPRLIGREIADLNRITQLIQGALERNTSAKAAAEIAVYDLFGQLYRAPLYRMLGGGGDPVISTDITISVDSIDKMVAESMSAIERGFESLKIKVGKDIGLDIERVKAIHAAVDGRALLRLDANQGWTAKQAVHAIHTLEDAGVDLELLEQPVRARDLAGLKYVTERIDTPVMADESVFGPAEVIELIRLRAADIINIKLMKTGGISNAVRIADIAAVHGVECMIGCMIESSISVAAAVHLAIAKSDAITKVDLDGPSLCVFDPVDGGVLFNESEISVSEAPGLGIREIHGLQPLDGDVPALGLDAPPPRTAPVAH
ncbi:dipeptide epimerase [soil metagenome]